MGVIQIITSLLRTLVAWRSNPQPFVNLIVQAIAFPKKNQDRLYLTMTSIIDRREILNLLWGNDSFFNSRNLDVYITKLRSYLKDDPSLEIITIKGIGYRFVVG